MTGTASFDDDFVERVLAAVNPGHVIAIQPVATGLPLDRRQQLR
ncbi:MAG: hypothetical protein ACJ74F_27550 [Mycobacterium sp.]